MMSVMSEDSELDLDLTLHISDNEEEDNDGIPSAEMEETLLDSSEEQDTLEEGDYNEDVEDGGEGNEKNGVEVSEAQNTDDIEELLDAEIIVKADFHKKHNEVEESYLGDNDDSNSESGGVGEDPKDAPEANEEKTTEDDSHQRQNKDDGDLLLVMDEKAADVDANEYAKSVLEHRENSKSPPSLNGNEESDDKTENEQPDDLMDIGDNIIDIGEQSTTTVAQEEGQDGSDVAQAHNDKTSEENEDNSVESMEVVVEEEDLGENVTNESATIDDLDHSDDAGEKIDEIVENGAKKEDGDGKRATFIKLEGQCVTIDKNGVVKQFIKKRRGRPPKVEGRRSLEGKDSEKSTAELEEQPSVLPADVDSNKENVQDKEMKTRLKSGQAAQFGMTTRSLRKRVSTDAGELGDKTKKFKADVSTEEAVAPENTDANEASVTSSDNKAHPAADEAEGSEQHADVSKEDVQNQGNDETEKEDTRQPNGVKVNCKLGTEEELNFRKMIVDKTLKGMSRETLEAFVVQKIGEALVYKSEVASLLKIIKVMESTTDSTQKEIVSLKKQSRDLNIVNEKILQDLHRFKDNPSKPLRIPSITRSVGLQAGSHDNGRKPALGSIMKPQVLPPLTKIAPRLPVTTVATPTTQVLVKVVPQQMTPKSVPALSSATVQKAPKAILPVKPTSKATSPKVEKKAPTVTSASNAPSAAIENGGGAGVIDLTSDDEKKISHTPVTTALQHVGKFISTPNGQKFMYQKQVLVKLPQGNYILNNSVQNSVLRASNPVNTTIAAPGSTKVAPSQIPLSSAPRMSTQARARPMKTKHPAPLPIAAQKPIHSFKPIPPRPTLTLRKTDCGSGILLSWNIKSALDMFAEIASYQIYVYPETKDEPRTENWVKVGDVDALQLPIAVTLTEFAPNNRYFFAVRAVDILTRVGPFSEYQTIAV